MNTAIHTFSIITSVASMDERDRLCSAWRIAAQDVADGLRFIAQYQRVIAEADEMLTPVPGPDQPWRTIRLHKPADVERAAKLLPWRLSLYLEHVKAVSIAEQRMTEARIAFAKSSDAWEN